MIFGAEPSTNEQLAAFSASFEPGKVNVFIGAHCARSMGQRTRQVVFEQVFEFLHLLCFLILCSSPQMLNVIISESDILTESAFRLCETQAGANC